jgi:sugar lactone lactonase YvrE
MKGRTFLISLLVILGLLILYLLLWPVPIDPAPFSPPEAPGLTGVYEVNDYLSGIERLETNMGHAMEGVAIDKKGRIYAGLKDGRIVRFEPDGSNPEVFADVNGWPFGLDFDSAGNLIVCNGKEGLVSVSPAGEVTILSTEEGGVPFRFVDGVDVAPDGIIYFTDASSKFADDHFMDDILEHRPNGRLLSYNPKSGETRLVLGDLYFPNGIAVSEDSSFLLFVETSMYRVSRYWLRGPKAGESEVLIDNLPGFPDGLFAGENGVFWVTIMSPRNELADKVLFPRPGLRKVLRRLPECITPAAVDYGFIIGLDSEGNVVRNLQDPSGSFGQITNVVEYRGMLYMGSLSEDAVGRIAVPKM